MMSMRWRKVLGDLKQGRVKIVAMMLVLGLGVAGVTAALAGLGVLGREIPGSFSSARVPDLALMMERVDDAVLERIARNDDVEAVDARRVIYARIQDRTGVWLPIRLHVIRDFRKQMLGRVHRHGGDWPDPGQLDEHIYLEQSGEALLDTRTDSAIKLRRPDGEIVTLRSAGAVHDPAVAPSFQERLLYGYATPAVAVRLGHSATLDQALIKLRYRGPPGEVLETGNALRAALQRDGMTSFRADVLPAGHPHAMLMNGMLRVLAILAALAFGCSAALVGYMMSALMRQERRAVGIMKTLGARWHQIGLQYLYLTLPLVLLALAVALPIGILLGDALVRHHEFSLNIDIADRDSPAVVWPWVLGLSLGIPLVAVAIPILRAALMSARAAIADTDISQINFGAKLAARLIHVPASLKLVFALRNSWRRPWRSVLMVAGLSFAGALLLLTHTNYQSMLAVIDTSLAHRGYDIDVTFPKTAPGRTLTDIASGVDGVAAVEAWRRASVTFAQVDSLHETEGRITRTLGLTGYPEDTRMLKLPIVRGRAPQPGTHGEMLITRALHHAFPQIDVGTRLLLQFRDRQTHVTVVGMVEEIAAVRMYAPFATFEAVTALGDASSLIRVQASQTDLPAVMHALDERFIAARMAPLQAQSRDILREALVEHFNVVGDVVRMAALAIALIGMVLLVSTTLLNLMERKRETGVLRTLGATPSTLIAIFLAEAGSLIALSFGLAIALSIPISLAMLKRAETLLLHVTVPMHFSLTGLGLLWCGALIVVATILLLIWRSVGETVRETLQYE